MPLPLSQVLSFVVSLKNQIFLIGRDFLVPSNLQYAQVGHTIQLIKIHISISMSLTYFYIRESWRFNLKLFILKSLSRALLLKVVSRQSMMYLPAYLSQNMPSILPFILCLSQLKQIREISSLLRVYRPKDAPTFYQNHLSLQIVISLLTPKGQLCTSVCA